MKKLKYFYIVEKGNDERIIVANPYPTKRKATDVMNDLIAENAIPRSDCMVRGYDYRRELN